MPDMRRRSSQKKSTDWVIHVRSVYKILLSSMASCFLKVEKKKHNTKCALDKCAFWCWQTVIMCAMLWCEDALAVLSSPFLFSACFPTESSTNETSFLTFGSFWFRFDGFHLKCKTVSSLIFFTKSFPFRKLVRGHRDHFRKKKKVHHYILIITFHGLPFIWTHLFMNLVGL